MSKKLSDCPRNEISFWTMDDGGVSSRNRSLKNSFEESYKDLQVQDSRDKLHNNNKRTRIILIYFSAYMI